MFYAAHFMWNMLVSDFWLMSNSFTMSCTFMQVLNHIFRTTLQLTMSQQAHENEGGLCLPNSNSSSSDIVNDHPLSKEETIHHNSRKEVNEIYIKGFTSHSDHDQYLETEVPQQEKAPIMCTQSIVVFSANTKFNHLSKLYKDHSIRWKTCKTCRAEDPTQDSFVSELVLGVDHCLCSVVGKQQEGLIDNHCKGKADGVQTSKSDPGSHSAHRDRYNHPSIEKSEDKQQHAHSGK